MSITGLRSLDIYIYLSDEGKLESDFGLVFILKCCWIPALFRALVRTLIRICCARAVSLRDYILTEVLVVRSELAAPWH